LAGRGPIPKPSFTSAMFRHLLTVQLNHLVSCTVYILSISYVLTAFVT